MTRQDNDDVVILTRACKLLCGTEDTGACRLLIEERRDFYLTIFPVLALQKS